MVKLLQNNLPCFTFVIVLCFHEMKPDQNIFYVCLALFKTSDLNKIVFVFVQSGCPGDYQWRIQNAIMVRTYVLTADTITNDVMTMSSVIVLFLQV